MIGEKYIYGILICAAGLTACAEDDSDDVYATREDRDWYRIEDKPGALNQEIYRVYTECGCPIFVNDTLGVVSEGVDANGIPYTEYETLKIGYDLEVHNLYAFALSQDTNLMIEAVKILGDKAFKIGKQVNKLPVGVLLVDTMYVKSGDANLKVAAGNVYSSLQVCALGMVQPRLNDPGECIPVTGMDDDEQMFWGCRLIGVRVLKELYELYSERLENEFFPINAESPTKAQLYGSDIKKNSTNWKYNCWELGFLSWYYYNVEVEEKDPFFGTITITYKNRTLDKEADLVDYFAAVYAFSPQLFGKKFGEYPVVMKKYNYIRNFLLELGYLK